MLKLCSRYVDDTNLVLKGIDGDGNQNQDERTMTSRGGSRKKIDSE